MIKKRIITAICFILIIFFTFFIHFGYPLLSGEYKENSMISTIIVLAILLFSVDKLVKLLKK